MSHHKCACECERAKAKRRWDYYEAQRKREQEKVNAEPERERVEFAWKPLRCPTTKKLYWLRKVTIVERSKVVRHSTFGGIVVYDIEWKTAWLEGA